MAKKINRKKTGRCVLCVNAVDNLTSEHLLPKAWYTLNAPEGCYKQTFPSCYDCNKDNGQSEERLLRSIGLSLNEYSPGGAGIQQKVIHSMSMTEAPNEREAQIRGRVKAKFLNSCITVPAGQQLDGLPLLPGMRVDPELLKNGGCTLSTVNGADVRRFVEKVVRGIMHLEYGLYVEKDQEIRLFGKPQAFVNQFADRHLWMPGLVVSFGSLPDASMPAVLFEVRLWGQLTVQAACMPRQDEDWKNRVLSVTEVSPSWDIESGTYDKARAGG